MTPAGPATVFVINDDAALRGAIQGLLKLVDDATTTVDTYKVGTLVIDLFDSKTEKLIWRSSSSDTLSNNADKNTKNLDKGVNKMFRHFPPAPKKQ